MKRQVIVIALFSLVTIQGLFAQKWPEYSIRDINFSYLSPEGRGTAKEFDFQTQLNHLVRLKLLKEQTSVTVFVDAVETVYEDAGQEILNIDSLNLVKGNLTTTSNNIKLSLESLNKIDLKDNTSLTLLTAQCRKARVLNSKILSIIDACTTNSKITLEEYKTINLNHFFKGFLSIGDKNSTNTIIKKIRGNINNHKINLSAIFQGTLNVNLNAVGNILYNEKLNQIELRVDKVKASFLNITRKFFDEIKKNESSEFIVQRPYIYIKLNN